MGKLHRKIFAYTLLVLSVFLPSVACGEKDKKDWFPFSIPWNYCNGSKVNMSFLLDPPAGRYGFLTVKSGHFYFQDGKRAKFWGVNLHSNRACFPEHDQAKDIAKRLAQLGCNIVRMHLLDNEAPGGIIDSSYNDSQHLSAQQLDKLDYFIYELKRNGIYVCFDVLGLGARRFKPGDNVTGFSNLERGSYGISFFDTRIKELSKKFAIDFLSHVNPYTGNSYLNEPCIAFVEMTNENTMFLKNLHTRFPAYYMQEIEGVWKGWLNIKGMNEIKGKWYEDKEFLFELQDTYQREMYDYLRSIGVKVPIGASNLPYENLVVLADSHMDFVDTHVYWDLSDDLVKIHNRPLIKQSHLNPRTVINNMSIAKAKGKPLIFTEWGSLWPNDWRAVDLITTAAYASLNDWDALFIYSYNGGWGLSWDGLENRLYYATVIFNDPAKMGLFPAAGLIFLRGDIQKSRYDYTASYDVRWLFKMDDEYKDRTRTAGIPYVSRFEKGFYTGNLTMPEEPRYPSVKGLDKSADETVTSDTGEIFRDSKKGIFLLNTPRAFSFSGFTGGQGQALAGDTIRFSTENDFSVFTAVSLDGRDINDSRNILLTLVGRVRNTGQALAPDTTKEIDDLNKDVYILNKGWEPILVEAIEGEVIIKKGFGQKRIRVFCLTENGLRKSEIQVNSHRGYYSFNVSGANKTIYYEIMK